MFSVHSEHSTPEIYIYVLSFTQSTALHPYMLHERRVVFKTSAHKLTDLHGSWVIRQVAGFTVLEVSFNCRGRRGRNVWLALTAGSGHILFLDHHVWASPADCPQDPKVYSSVRIAMDGTMSR